MEGEGQENEIPFLSQVESEVCNQAAHIVLINLLPIKVDHIYSYSNRALLSMLSEYSLYKGSCFMPIVNTLQNKIIQHVVHIQI